MTPQEYQHAYYEAHKDRKKAYRREWYAANREHVLAQKKEYWVRKKDEIKPKQRARRQREDKAARNARLREYRKLPHVKERRHAEHRRYAERYPEKRRDKFLRENYGIGLAEYNEKFNEQNGLCAICHKPPVRVFDVDHNHTTSAVRGLLCRKCNNIVGALEGGLVPNAQEYLRKWGEECL